MNNGKSDGHAPDMRTREKPKVFGYCRVSSVDQNEIRQMIAMERAGIDVSNIYIDKISGRNFNRPNYQRLKRRLVAGDVLYVMSIDRLG